MAAWTSSTFVQEGSGLLRRSRIRRQHRWTHHRVILLRRKSAGLKGFILVVPCWLHRLRVRREGAWLHRFLGMVQCRFESVIGMIPRRGITLVDIERRRGSFAQQIRVLIARREGAWLHRFLGVVQCRFESVIGMIPRRGITLVDIGRRRGARRRRLLPVCWPRRRLPNMDEVIRFAGGRSAREKVWVDPRRRRLHCDEVRIDVLRRGHATSFLSAGGRAQMINGGAVPQHWRAGGRSALDVDVIIARRSFGDG